MEYACVVWDTHIINAKYQSWKKSKGMQQLRWVLSDYSYHSSVSSILEQLNWLPLVKRRKQQRLNLFYEIRNGEIALSLPDCYHFTNKHTSDTTHLT